MIRTTVTYDLTRLILKRDNYSCYFCHKKLKQTPRDSYYNPNRPLIHHIHYPARSFKDLVTCCYECNGNRSKVAKKIKKEHFLKFYKQGLNDSNLAKKFKVSTSKIAKIRKKIGLNINIE